MYVALYRKYRPKLFRDVLSQNNITKTLKNEVKLKKIAHSYIFSGPKGTGKTTCAKIFSQAINCENPKDGEPCLKCDICLKIKDKTILDITELDGASNNGVNDVRILRDEANFVPTYCKYRIYIIDEAHMLSSSAFNALLKIMEEPPSCVVFILATTDIAKIPQTVISRCQRFDFNRITTKDIKLKVQNIAIRENIEISDDASTKIAEISNGSMRDAISIFDRCSITENKITTSVLNEYLGFLDEKFVLSLHRTILEKNSFEAVKIINDIYFSGKNLEYVVLELVNFYREMLYYEIFGEDYLSFLEYFKYYETFKKTRCLEYKNILYILEELVEYYEKIKHSTNQKLFLELLIFKICKENIKDEHIEKFKRENENFKESIIKYDNVISKDHKKEKLIKNIKEENVEKNNKKDCNIKKFIKKKKKNNIEVEEEWILKLIV